MLKLEYETILELSYMAKSYDYNSKYCSYLIFLSNAIIINYDLYTFRARNTKIVMIISKSFFVIVKCHITLTL